MVRDAALDRVPHGLGDGTVLEERLAEEAEVVHDHVGARGEQAFDRSDHLEAVGRPCEEQLRTRRDVVHDLEQRDALVAAAPRAAVRDGHVAEIAALQRLPQAVDAVGDDTDDHPAAVGALGANEVGPRRRVAFGRCAADPENGRVGRTHRTHPPELGDLVERGGVDAAADAPAIEIDTVDRHAGLLERRQLLGAQLRAIHVHPQLAVRRARRVGRYEGAGERPHPLLRGAQPTAHLAGRGASVRAGSAHEPVERVWRRFHGQGGRRIEGAERDERGDCR